MKALKLGLIALGLLAITTSAMAAEEKDPIAKRVPKEELAAAQKATYPFKVTPEIVAEGKELFNGKGTCFTCHGFEGKGDGPAGMALDPAPRNFANKDFHKNRTPGEFMWILKHGSAGTAMVPFVGSPGAVINEEEAWKIVAFEFSVGQ